VSSIHAEWMWGWDPTPGIVSVHADLYGRAIVWRRDPATSALLREDARFRPWLLLDRLDDLLHVGTALGTEDDPKARFRHRELDGPGALRHLVTADNGRTLTAVLLHGASRRLGRRIPNLGDRFLRHALARLLVGDVAGVREVYVETVSRLRARAVPTHDVSSLVRLTKEPAEYLETRARRRELAYEALLAAGRSTWRVGDRVRVYRKQNGEGGLAESPDEDATAAHPRDYDAGYYVRLLRSTYAERLARAFTAQDFARVFADAEQLDLLAPGVEGVRPVLRMLPAAAW
jgi:hypothetical protein